MKSKKIVCMLLALFMFSTMFYGCIGRISGEELDKNKTQLYIGVYNGGLGTAWINAVKKEFEEYYKDESFEPNKKGVQVMIDPKISEFEKGSLIPAIQAGSATNDIYYTSESGNDFYPAKVRAGTDSEAMICADVTDIVTEKIYDANGNLGGNVMSIADKMMPSVRELYSGYDQGKYYGVPFEYSLMGIVYDRDLFEEEGWITNSPGPSGIDDPDAYDYGMPATFNDFKNLFADMLNASVTPWTYTGANAFYASPIGIALQAQVDGESQFTLNTTYDGYLTTSVDSEINEANDGQGTLITPENGHLLARQNGKKQALEFYHFITSDSRYYTNYSFTSSQTHHQAQNEFVTSMAEDIKTNRIAMIIEGEWWENEARGRFTTMENAYRNPDYGYGKRDFRFLPLPRMDGQSPNDDGYYQSAFAPLRPGTLTFINNLRPEVSKNLAKLWFQFALSNDSLATFTEHTGAKLPYNYNLSDSQYNGLTKFAKSVWDLKTNDNGPLLYTYPNASRYGRLGNLTMNTFDLPSQIGSGAEQNSPISWFRQNTGADAVDTYFNGISTRYSEQAWANSYQMYLTSYGA